LIYRGFLFIRPKWSPQVVTPTSQLHFYVFLISQFWKMPQNPIFDVIMLCNHSLCHIIKRDHTSFFILCGLSLKVAISSSLGDILLGLHQIQSQVSVNNDHLTMLTDGWVKNASALDFGSRRSTYTK